MFISEKRHEREKQELLSAANRLTTAMLKTTAQGIFLLDAKDRILPQVSDSLATLFGREDFEHLSFEKLIAPVVTARTLASARAFIGKLRDQAPQTEIDNPLLDVEVRIPNPAGAAQLAHYSFEFEPLEVPREGRVWLVRVSDITTRVEERRELEELRVHKVLLTQLLSSVLAGGGERLGAFLERTEAAMKSINTVLRRPARAAEAFRDKLKETLKEVDRVRREAARLQLGELAQTAAEFEEALSEANAKASLSGSDFLPLAVKLDALYGRFVAIRTLAMQAAPGSETTRAARAPRQARTPAAQASSALEATRSTSAPAGSLEKTLGTLAEILAEEHRKTIVLEVKGVEQVPAGYQATVKNIALQMIRNAIMHGIEPSAQREADGKPRHGTLRLEFKVLAKQGYELSFKDDGCGINPQTVREVALARGLLSEAEAAKLRDRQVIKVIFRSAYSTLPNTAGAPKHGKGMSLVRRYVHDAGGKIALASVLGRETRFKVTLPPVSEAAQVA